ncbi:MAG: PLP-dependent aminotransferase family protein [Acidimicrobiales bacterium]
MTIDLHITLDRNSEQPLPRQLADRIRTLISGGQLAKGTRLPPTRTLAAELAIGRRSVVDAFEQLVGEGWLQAKHGSGTWVAEVQPIRMAATESKPDLIDPEVPPFDLFPGEIEISDRLQTAWRSAIRRARLEGTEVPDLGVLRLRAAIAHYLTTNRGFATTASDVIVTAGTTESMLLVGTALALSNSRVGIEDPGYPRTAAVLRMLGATLCPIAVGDDGIDVNQVAEQAAALKAVTVSPSHQYPTGHRMPIRARQSLIALSRESGFTIVEDDYDSEFRYEAPPLAPLATLDEHVIYLGTFSKLLDPGLRTAYVVTRGDRRAQVEHVRRSLGPTVAWPIQAAIADLIESGELEAIAASQRRRYAARRRLVADRLTAAPGVLRVSGLDAGLHVTLELDHAIDASAVQAELLEAGVVVGTLDDCRIEPDVTTPGLIVSYAGHDLDSLSRCANTIVASLASA